MFETRNKVVDLDINDVLPNRFQPRVKFNEDAIIELAESIKEHGIIQPIIVRPIGDKYEIIAGERRYKASILAGKESIPAIITDLNDKDSAEIALIENVQRKNLTPIEEAVSYKKILDMGLTQEQLALKLGKSQSSIANKMRLLNLSDEVQEALIEEKISERHARSLLKLPKAELQNQLLDRIINERLTVRKTDEEIEKMKEEFNVVEEPSSMINTGAFINSNPGFVDVDKIENQAKELEEERPRVDINALLRPDSSSMNNQVNSSVSEDSKPSIFSIFGKPSTQEQNSFQPFNVEKPVVEEREDIKPENRSFIPLDSFDDSMDDSIDNSSNNNLDNSSFSSSYNFEPLSFESNKQEAPAPLDISSFNNDMSKFDSLLSDTSITSVNPLPEIDIKEPEMPTIDLSTISSIKEEPSVSNEPEIINVEPKVNVEPTPVVNNNINEYVNHEPILISDYEKQYDPIINTAPSYTVERIPFKDVLTSIRENVNDIERAGYGIDTDEIDLGNEYRIIITINKEGK